MIQTALLILLTVIEVVAFAWLIINMKKAREQQLIIFEVEKQILKVERTILRTEKKIMKQLIENKK
jgi:hypothetical protein